ncbi:MAG: TAXI family TRAP transporter solute-binding subunit [Desulfuromonadales bacterium]|nr:TAXI family TRAP transporter solute-binding subunit [Desulfuromonadales bacterium]
MQRTFIALSILLLVALIWLAADRSTEEVRLGVGPEGGTFIVYAKGLAELLRQELPELQLKVTSSGGSTANLNDIEEGKVALALTYAADAYLGSQGLLKKHPTRLANVQALGRVYGSTAQLVVLKESIIKTPEDLVNRRVAIGSSGSGAAHSAERYFRSLGIWDEITPLYLGYDLAMGELISRRAQAVWQLVGAPCAAIVNTSRKHPLRLIDLAELADQSDFLLEYPFYTRVSIPAGTYSGQTRPIDSFQDNTLLVAHPGTDPQLIATTLHLLFSPKGMQQMRKIHPIAKDLDVQKGLQGIQIPLHPEAVKFWREQGVLK